MPSESSPASATSPVYSPTSPDKRNLWGFDVKERKQQFETNNSQTTPFHFNVKQNNVAKRPETQNVVYDKQLLDEEKTPPSPNKLSLKLPATKLESFAPQEAASSPIQIVLPDFKIVSVSSVDTSVSSTLSNEPSRRASLANKVIARKISISIESPSGDKPNQIIIDTTEELEEENNVPKLVEKFETLKRLPPPPGVRPRRKNVKEISNKDETDKKVEEKPVENEEVKDMEYQVLIKQLKAIRKEIEWERENILTYYGNGEDYEYRHIKEKLMSFMTKLDEMKYEDVRIDNVVFKTFEFCHKCLEELIMKVKKNQW